MRPEVSAAARAEAPAVLRLAPLGDARAVFASRGHGNASFLVGGGDPAAARRSLGPLAGVRAGATVFMEQVHGASVAVVSGADGGRGLDAHGDAVGGVDALVTAEPGLALAVLTADCLPVLLSAEGAVAAAHAGRAGLLSGVLEATVEALSALGAPPAAVTAVIGPAIGGCCYEVPAALARAATGAVAELAATTSWGTPALDLPRGAAALLRRAGVGRVGMVDACTRCAPGRWFSHRAVTDGRHPSGEPGRQASVVAIAPDGGEPLSAPPQELRWLS